MSKKTYIVESYDPATRKIERVTVTHEVYNAYRRSGWNIADNNQSFFKHEIQMSSLIGGEDGGYDNFREFIGDPEAVDNAVAERMLLEALYKAIAELNAKLLMLEQLRSKGYLAPEVYQAQANEISAELAKLKDVRQEKFNSKAAIMLEEVKKLKMLIFELEEPLDAFDEKLFLEIVKSIQINKEDEMSVELLGGLRFRERI